MAIETKNESRDKQESKQALRSLLEEQQTDQTLPETLKVIKIQIDQSFAKTMKNCEYKPTQSQQVVKATAKMTNKDSEISANVQGSRTK